jgi:hypothetical protein
LGRCLFVLLTDQREIIWARYHVWSGLFQTIALFRCHCHHHCVAVTLVLPR